jgi:hypothetical protein
MSKETKVASTAKIINGAGKFFLDMTAILLLPSVVPVFSPHEADVAGFGLFLALCASLLGLVLICIA